jgi:hypothetical protein
MLQEVQTFPHVLIALMMRKVQWFRSAGTIEFNSSSQLPNHRFTIRLVSLLFSISAPLALQRGSINESQF